MVDQIFNIKSIDNHAIIPKIISITRKVLSKVTLVTTVIVCEEEERLDSHKVGSIAYPTAYLSHEGLSTAPVSATITGRHA